MLRNNGMTPLRDTVLTTVQLRAQLDHSLVLRFPRPKLVLVVYVVLSMLYH
jgi:hypothetical protein